MSHVAFNMNGEPFDPSPAAYWRVRRVRDRGLEVAYKRGVGTPIFAPVEITPEEFQRLVDFEEGKYRLDALTEDYQPVENVPPAYIVVKRTDSASSSAPPPEIRNGNSATAEPPKQREPALSETAELLRMVVKANAKTTRVIARQYAAVLDAAARVLNAEATSLPARSVYEQQRNAAAALATGVDPVPANDETDEADDESGDDYNMVKDVCETVRAVVPPLASLVGVGVGALRNRKDKPRRNSSETESTKSDDASSPPPRRPNPAAKPREAENPAASTSAANDKPRTDVPIGLRLMSIQSALTSEEFAYALAVYNELTEAERQEWANDLAEMSDDEIIATIRGKYHEHDNDPDDDNPNKEDNDQDGIDANAEVMS